MRQDHRNRRYLQLLEEGLLTMEGALVAQTGRESERCALATESLLASGRLRLQVRGASMLPTLWPGDRVEIRSCSVDELTPGEIVLAGRGGRFFLHRFLGRTSTGGFLLRGDSMPAADPEFSDEALLGRLVSCEERFSEHSAHVFLPLRPWTWALGQLFCFSSVARRLALWLHFSRKRPERDFRGIAGRELDANDLISSGADFGAL